MDDLGDFLWSLLIGIAFVLGTILLVLSAYFLARRLLHPGGEGDRTMEVAGNVAVRIATLHGLILGLVYAQELDDYKGVRSTLTDESIAISDVWNDARRYGGDAVAPIQQGLAVYLRTVVDEEWKSLGRHEGLSGEAWQEWDRVYAQILDLQPQTDRQRYLSQHMHERITAVARFRQLREVPSVGKFAGVFWGPALIGLVLVAAAFYVYRPTRTHLVLFSLFGAYSGVILFFIFAFSNPYAAPGKLAPAPFQHLLEGAIGKSLPAR